MRAEISAAMSEFGAKMLGFRHAGKHCRVMQPRAGLSKLQGPTPVERCA
jgi:hypothetical protein